MKIKIETRIGHFESGGKPLVEIVLDLAYQYKLPMGLEYVDQAAATQPINLSFHNRPVRDVLAAIVGELPEYRMTVSGLVQIYSPRARMDPSNLLNRTMRNFDLVNEDTHRASADLHCALARELNPHMGCFVSIGGGQWGALKVTIHARNAKVYQIIDEIVTQNGSAVWTVLVPPSKLTTIPRDLWYIYPLDPAFQQVAVDSLTHLFPVKGAR